MQKTKNKLKLLLSVLLLIALSLEPLESYGQSSQQDFVISNETITVLDETFESKINGTIFVAVESGGNVTATVNGNSKVIQQGYNRTFSFTNTTTLVFRLSSEGNAEGFFIADIAYDRTGGGTTPFETILWILGGLLFAAAFLSYYIRASRLKRKPGEKDSEVEDKETLKKQREAAGAQKRYFGKD